jgi:hypothetical protein
MWHAAVSFGEEEHVFVFVFMFMQVWKDWELEANRWSLHVMYVPEE